MDALSSEIVSLEKENEDLKYTLILLRSLKILLYLIMLLIIFSGIDMIREIHERDSKSRNIMLFNIEEWVSDIDSLTKELITKLN